MKSVVISIVIALAIVAGSVAYGNHMHKVSDTLISINDKLIEEIDGENYEQAENVLENAIMYIESNRTMLSAMDNHESIDKIELNIYELYEYIKGEEKTDALSKCRMLGVLYKHLPKDYELKLENIL